MIMTKLFVIDEGERIIGRYDSTQPAAAFIAMQRDDGRYVFARPGSTEGWLSLDELFAAFQASEDMGASLIRKFWPDIDGPTLDMVRAMLAAKMAEAAVTK